MAKDFLGGTAFFDAGDDASLSAAGAAEQLEQEHAPEEIGPGDAAARLRSRQVGSLGLRLGEDDLLAPKGGGGEHAAVADHVLAGERDEL